MCLDRTEKNPFSKIIPLDKGHTKSRMRTALLLVFDLGNRWVLVVTVSKCHVKQSNTLGSIFRMLTDGRLVQEMRWQSNNPSTL